MEDINKKAFDDEFNKSENNRIEKDIKYVPVPEIKKDAKKRKKIENK